MGAPGQVKRRKLKVDVPLVQSHIAQKLSKDLYPGRPYSSSINQLIILIELTPHNDSGMYASMT